MKEPEKMSSEQSDIEYEECIDYIDSIDLEEDKIPLNPNIKILHIKEANNLLAWDRVSSKKIKLNN